MYFYGEGGDRNYDEAYKFFKKAADKGSSRSQYMLHYFYLYDEKYRNYNAGCTYLIKSAEDGDVLAQTLLGRIYAHGQFGLPESDERFIYWIQKAAEQGHAEAEYILGRAYIEFEGQNVLSLDCEKALFWLKKAADHGYADAFLQLAEYYYAGNRIKKDEQSASTYASQYEKLLHDYEANGRKSPDSWYKLAKCYEEFSSNGNKALDCYWRALRDGKLDALYDVGWAVLLNEKNSTCRTMSNTELIKSIQDHAKTWGNSDLSFLMGKYYDKIENWENSEYWYLDASKKGSVNAKWLLACLYTYQLQRYNDAFKYAQEAHDAGSAQGSCLLGLAYKLGLGVTKDKKKAKEILKIAAERGSEFAAKELKKFFF